MADNSHSKAGSKRKTRRLLGPAPFSAMAASRRGMFSSVTPYVRFRQLVLTAFLIGVVAAWMVGKPVIGSVKTPGANAPTVGGDLIKR